MEETPSRREQAREERRQQILEAALEVFLEQGFHATNVSDVAARAGVSQGTIYWYFASKEELFEAAILAFFQHFGEEAVAPLHRYETATEKLRALGHSLDGFAEIAGSIFPMFIGYWYSSPRRQESASFWLDLLVEFKDIVSGIIEGGIESGEFRPVDVDSLVWSLLAAYDGLAAYLLFVPDLEMAKASEAFLETMLRGLATDRKADD